MQRLTGPQLAILRKSLLKSFKVGSFNRFLADRLDRDLESITTANGFEDKLFDVLDTANRELWLIQLVNAAIAMYPDDADLQNIVVQTGLINDKTGGFEVLVKRSGFISAGRLFAYFGQIGRVEMGQTILGTGFLVSPDLVMTNYHVVKEFMGNAAATTSVVVRFDYRHIGAGETVYAGTPIPLAAANPIPAYSPFTPEDDQAMPLSFAFPKDRLDFAILRLAQPVGAEPAGPRLGGVVPGEGPERGWIKYPAVPPGFTPNGDIFIIQHPEGDPLQISMGHQKGVDANGVRVRYDADTLPGSSGSPIFNDKGQWIGLHHYGSETRGYNQGIPAHKIIESLPDALRNELAAE